MQNKTIQISPFILSGQKVWLLRAWQQLFFKRKKLFGSWRIIRFLAHIWPAWQRMSVIDLDDHPFYLDLRDPAYISILINGISELSEMKLVSKWLHPNSVCLDIGANAGIWSRFLAQKCPQGQIYAFEPSLTTFNLLIDNCRDINQVECQKLAFSDSIGEMLFGGNFWADTRHLGGHGETVQVTTMDTWKQEKGINQLDFVKLDVEGAELKVLKGGIHTLQRFKPLILFEYIPENAANFDGYTRNDILALLQDIGYTIRRVQKNGALSSELDMTDNVTSNYLALIE